MTTTSHPQTARRGILMGAIVAGGLLATLVAPAQAMPLTPAPAVAGEADVTTVQYGWGPRHHHHHHGGWGRPRHWGHHHHGGWGRSRHWGHHHHDRGWGRHRGWGHHHGHWH